MLIRNLLISLYIPAHLPIHVCTDFFKPRLKSNIHISLPLIVVIIDDHNNGSKISMRMQTAV